MVSIHSILGRVFIAASACLAVTASPGAERPPRSLAVFGEGETWADSPSSFAGEGTIFVRGRPQTLEIHTVMLGAPLVDDDGVLHVATSHTFRFGSSVITTRDEATALPTETPGLYILISDLTVVDGGCGRMLAVGTIDLIAGHVVYWFSGAIRIF